MELFKMGHFRHTLSKILEILCLSLNCEIQTGHSQKKKHGLSFIQA